MLALSANRLIHKDLNPYLYLLRSIHPFPTLIIFYFCAALSTTVENYLSINCSTWFNIINILREGKAANLICNLWKMLSAITANDRTNSRKAYHKCYSSSLHLLKCSVNLFHFYLRVTVWRQSSAFQ